MNLRTLNAAVLLALLTTGSALAHDTHTTAAPDATPDNVPLYDNLGRLSYRISTQNPLAQRYFDQGLRLTYAFNHAEALRAFRAAQAADPECALCYWGEAFVLGPNINAPMDAAADNPAVTAIAKAQQRAERATAAEQALIAALATRYTADPAADRVALNTAYADAMAAAAGQFPDDPEIAVLYVDALMNLSPWDYWEADGVTPKGRIGEAIATAERVMAAHPDHPGAIHLYIHLTEASNTPERAEGHADRLAALMPGAGHIVHMASHTYYRVGRYGDSSAINQDAVRADEAYLAQSVIQDGIYPYGYYPHNIHFVMASALMAGDGPTALEYARRLDGKIPDEFAQQVGWVQAIRNAPYFVHARFAAPEAVLALADPGPALPFVQAMRHYARAVAYVRQGALEQAQTEAAQMAELRQNSDFSLLLAWAVPAPDVIDLARHVVEGRLAQAQNDPQRAVREFRIAVAIQDTLPYTEPPYWYYPVRQSLGAALLSAGQAEEAEQVFQRSLAEYPDNGWALWGLMQAQKMLGKTAQAHATAHRFQQAWLGQPSGLDLNRL